jgi:hypothetical protein
MRVALTGGQGEEAGAGGVEAFKGVGGGEREVDDLHRISSQGSLIRAERREFRGSCPSTPLSEFALSGADRQKLAGPRRASGSLTGNFRLAAGARAVAHVG